MSDAPERARVPLMTAEQAQELARGYKWMARSCANVGMVREAAQHERDSVWFMAYAISLAQTPPSAPPGTS